MNATEIRNKIKELKKLQRQYSFGMRKQNATQFGNYERKIEELYRKLDEIERY